MKNKKGFTLIELLAVIVILAIIALIATPIILNMINSAKKSAAKSAALGYIEAIEYNNGFAEVEQPGYTSVIGENLNVSDISIKVKGKKPSSGIVTVNSKGKVESANNLCFNGYEVDYDGKEATVGGKCNGSSTPVSQPQSFANDNWSTIAANTTSDKYKVGDTKCIALTGLTTTNDNGCQDGKFKVRIANKTACTTETSTTACGFVVEFVDIITTREINSEMTSVGGYPASAMYNEYFASNATNSLYAKLPSDLQSVIIPTTVVSGHGSTSGETNFTSQDKLYLLSTKEVGFNVSTDSVKDETRILDYYNTNNNNTSRVKQYNGSNYFWWLRSARSNATNSFCAVFGNGTDADAYYGGTDAYYFPNSTRGVAPAFRIGTN